MPPKFNYNHEAMQNALDAVEKGGMSKRKASKCFGVPRTTLSDKLSGRTPRERKMGHSPILTEQEEHDLVKLVNHSFQLINIVALSPK